MKYRVKQLAETSGVSVRTLHWYDEIGLLKPAYYGVGNRYRYYEEDQLLTLQQILFFRELEVPLNDIKELLHQDSFNKTEALSTHKRYLVKKIDRYKKLLATIDRTIKHLNGETKILEDELYEGFEARKKNKDRRKTPSSQLLCN